MEKISSIYRTFKDGLSFTFSNKPSIVWKHFHQRDCLPLFQFIKYALCGGMATIITYLFVWLLSRFFIFPSFEPEAIGLTNQVRGNNLIINNLISFPFINTLVYYANVIWVFERGRHSKLKEFAIFTTIALFATIVGLFAGPYLVKIFGIPSSIAQLCLIVTAALVNFVCRKFVIFLN